MNIKDVIDRYFAGDTSAAEEKFLINYFLDSDNIDDEFRYLQPLFGYLSEEAEGVRILSQIRDYDLRKPSKKNPQLKKIVTAASALAAVLIIGVFLLTGYLNNNKDTKAYVWVDGKRISDPELVKKYFETSFYSMASSEDILEQQLNSFFE